MASFEVDTDTTLETNLRAYYKLDGLLDETANNYDLTNTNSVAFSAAFKENGADGGTTNTNKKLDIASNLGISGLNYPLSISLWVKLNTEIGAGTYAFAWHSEDVQEVHFRIDYQYNGGTRRLDFNRVRTNVADGRFLYNITLGTTNWYHIVMRYNGSTLEGFVNGASVGTASVSGAGQSGSTDNEFHLVGRNDYTSGIIDEVGVWFKNLSNQEVADLYNGGAGNQYGDPASSGPANLKSLNTNLAANIKSYNTNLIANVKSINTNV